MPWQQLSLKARTGVHQFSYAIAYLAAVDESLEVAAGTLRRGRVQAGLTQAALGKRAGVSQALISAYENCHRQPTLPTLMRLVRAAGSGVLVQLSPLRTEIRSPDGPYEGTRSDRA